MNREILFRGKSVDHLGWEFGCLIESCGELFIGNTVGNHPENWCQIIPETVGQFTGLTDKNGTKIFEGDCVIFNKKNHIGMNGVVNYANHASFVVLTPDFIPNRKAQVRFSDIKELKITSNIHDNPTP